MKTMRTVMALVLAAALTGCDRGGGKGATTGVPGSAAYDTAMADYSAGRLDAATKGFAGVLRKHPENAAARFQLACLLQDRQGDYLGAVCHYREFLLQVPDGDKASLARRRLAACERLLESSIAKRLNLTDNTAVLAENAKLKAENEKSAQEIVRLKAEVAKTVKERDDARAEGKRLRRFVSSVAEDESTEKPKIDVSDAELVDEEEEESSGGKAMAAEVAQLTAEESEEQTATPFKTGVQPPPAPKKEGPKEPAHEKRPATYVVQEGDTLYKLAMRFYGRRSAWAQIRDLNKATISTDGRIKAGQTLKLPNPEM